MASIQIDLDLLLLDLAIRRQVTHTYVLTYLLFIASFPIFHI